MITSCSFLSAARDSGGWTVNTSRGKIRCSMLIIAAGAWAAPCAAGSGAGVPPFHPTTRHLFQSVRQNEFSKEAPFVWDIASECYVRPDGNRALLLSACDQDPCDPSMPLLPSGFVPGLLKEKMARAFPALAGIRIQRFWFGTRTLTPDGRFIIGPDPKIENLGWVGGLGGHGVTASPAVGRIAAESIMGLKPIPPELSCSRFN